MSGDIADGEGLAPTMVQSSGELGWSRLVSTAQPAAGSPAVVTGRIVCVMVMLAGVAEATELPAGVADAVGDAPTLSPDAPKVAEVFFCLL